MPPSARNQYPNGHVLYRRLAKSFPKVVRGEGCWLYDGAGKRYLDASSGALVANLGHGNAELAKAIGEQAAQAAGLVVRPNSGYTEQEDGDLVLIGPPFIITESEISELVERFRAALETAIKTIQ
jgi:adenosylmethionine-8-amino-7-oxononanoate aminotransferase